MVCPSHSILRSCIGVADGNKDHGQLVWSPKWGTQKGMEQVRPSQTSSAVEAVPATSAIPNSLANM